MSLRYRSRKGAPRNWLEKFVQHFWRWRVELSLVYIAFSTVLSIVYWVYD